MSETTSQFQANQILQLSLRENLKYQTNVRVYMYIYQFVFKR